MAFCGNCGTKVEEGKKFCPECGTVIAAQTAQQPQTQAQQPQQTSQIKLMGDDTTSNFNAADIEANKIMAVLAYIIFLIPLLAAKESPFAKFHTNQGLILFIAGVAVTLVGAIIPFLGWFVILPLGCLAVGVLGIIGIINAIGGKAKELPLIGKFRIIK